MKRALLIATGTIGGLGAVFAITPPQFGTSLGGGALGSSTGSLSAGGSLATPAATTATTPATTTTTPKSTPTPKSTKKSTAKATPKATPKKTSKTPTGTKTTASTPAPAASSAAPAPTPTKATATGTFTGSAVSTRYGTVQVQITVTNGKITAARGVQMPARDFRSQQISSQAEVYLVQETLAANSANIQGVGGASYTSQGWQQSLASAVAQAGL